MRLVRVFHIRCVAHGARGVGLLSDHDKVGPMVSVRRGMGLGCGGVGGRDGCRGRTRWSEFTLVSLELVPFQDLLDLI